MSAQGNHLLTKVLQCSKRTAMGILFAVALIFSFQNCTPIGVQEIKSAPSSKLDGTQTPQGQTPDGELLLPVPKDPHAIYVCPPGTKTSNDVDDDNSDDDSTSEDVEETKQASTEPAIPAGGKAAMIMGGISSGSEKNCSKEKKKENKDKVACVVQMTPPAPTPTPTATPDAQPAAKNNIAQQRNHLAMSSTQAGPGHVDLDDQDDDSNDDGNDNESALVCGCERVACTPTSLDPACQAALVQKVIK
jgi:hypothetical protein